MKVKFLKSGWRPDDYPAPDRPEIALVGRSNAGKSSFINALTGQRIAKVSQTPGKTRLLNFFDVGERLYLVDMPGYGFATGNRREVEGWREMIETYLLQRETLRGVVLIMDIRRPWSEDEAQLQAWFAQAGLRWTLVLNKADKLSRSAAASARLKLERELRAPVWALSSAKKTGFDEMEKLLFKEWLK
jgi:GTP-binding protein